MTRATTTTALLAGAAFAALLSPAASAQTATVGYQLEDVWVDTALTQPWLPPQQMTGRFEWTYTVGDFENGSAQFTELSIPYYGTNFSSLVTTIDLGRSQFHVENGVNYQGNVLSGSVVPEFQMALAVAGSCPTHQFQLHGVTANGAAALLYAFGTGGLVIPNGYPCAGTQLGLDGTTALGAVLTADANGDAVLVQTVPAGACGRIYLQALDLATCGLSPALLLR
ncbi:MAG: hypothetical protein H8E31_03115 [Planctomycetes bacterium]|nr:hypothetical protein [Planctomycetota bacterium]